MRKNIIKVLDLPSGGLASALIILSVMFAVGSIIGCAVADRINNEGIEALSTYLDGFLDVVFSAVESDSLAIVCDYPWVYPRWVDRNTYSVLNSLFSAFFFCCIFLSNNGN